MNSPLLDKSLDSATQIVLFYEEFSELKKDTTIAKQLLRSATSIGANINEAVYGNSKADFISKLHISLKETGESIYWLAVRFPDIAKQWHPTKNGKLNPEQVSFGSQKRVWWLGACGHEWQCPVSSRTTGNSGCPVCSGNLIVAGINDLLTKNPELAVEWDYEKNTKLTPSELSPFSHKKVWWKCSNCGNSWQAVVKNRTYGTHCPVCSRNKRKMKT